MHDNNEYSVDYCNNNNGNTRNIQNVYSLLILHNMYTVPTHSCKWVERPLASENPPYDIYHPIYIFTCLYMYFLKSPLLYCFSCFSNQSFILFPGLVNMLQL